MTTTKHSGSLKKELHLYTSTSTTHPDTSPILVKRGFREMSSHLTCGVLFESDPIWLWSLRPNSWDTIFITEIDEVRLRDHHPTLFARLKTKLTAIASTFCGDFPIICPDFMWICGSKCFIDMVSLPPSGHHIYCLTKSVRRLPSGSKEIQWIKLCHRSVGGVTNARGSFGVDSRSEKIIIPPDLIRGLGHVIKYSIRPKACSPVPSELHYGVSDLLSLSFPRRPVLYPTYMSGTGWGLRELSDGELSMCFDLPDYVSWEDRFLRDIIPLQLCRSVIESVTERFPEPPRNKIKTVVNTDDTPTFPSSHDVIWLEPLKRWLPGSWADGQISDKAVKSDNSPVDFRPWHRRIQLIMPCHTSTLSVFERLGMRRWRLNVVRSFFAYISGVYGPRWQSQFFSGPKRKIEDSLSASKRRRTVIGTTLKSFNGGVNVVMVPSLPIDQLRIDVTKGLLVLGQVIRSTWWEWTSGSAPLFWRWNGREQMSSARDGMMIYVQSALPRSRKGVKPSQFDSDTRKLVSSKVETMVAKSYLESGSVRTHLHYFAVPKGEDDIRVVFDGTSCGLNEALWSPNFFLPTSRHAAEMLSFESWMADSDFAEFFHNFFADDKVRKHAGVEVSHLSPYFLPTHASIGSPLKFEGLRWSRLFMGMKPSPYNAVRFYYWGEEFAMGNLRDKSNPFGFDKVILNLPGMDTYDTTKPKLMKWNSSRNFMSGGVVTFVDDVRMTGSSREHAHEVHRQFTSRMQYLGIQDAPRKFRPPSQNQAGAWTGTIFKITKNEISKTVSLEKWSKGRDIVSNLSGLLNDHPFERPLLNRKDLERQTGFLNHLAMTFDDMTPFLKGFYLTLNSWRPKRDKDDWKMSDKSWMQCLVAQLDNGTITLIEFENELNLKTEIGTPLVVTASSRLSDDVRSLMALFSSSTPPNINLRSKEIVTVVYGFGDASGTGLGATFTCGSGFNFRVGVWSSDESDESSNWREFTNIVESLEDEAESGHLAMSEIFMFTDNSTVEACAIKGSSSSRKLLELVVRLRSLTTKFGVKIHIFHVAGTRMIAQGTDGVSRGFLGEGIMSGESMVSYIPIHLSSTERSPTLLKWIREWTDPSIIHLQPIDWFDVAHDYDGWEKSWDGFDRPRLSEGRVYLWTPPPFAADIAIAELRKARIKRQTSSHVFVVPKLCAPLWIKQLFKASDIVFEIPSETNLGSSGPHQKCFQWVGNCVKCLKVKGWTHGIFCANFGNNVTGLDLCRRMWCGKCYSFSETPDFHVADPENLFSEDGDEDRLTSGWKAKPSDRSRYAEARDGDDLLVPFECDFCVFSKITGRSRPASENLSDDRLMLCIRRVMLDAFWSRARSTVATNTRSVREMMTISNSLGFDPPFEPPGPLPSFDHCGYRTAILMVSKSTQPGRHSASHIQWDTIRKLRSTVSNQSRASRSANFTTWSMTDYKGSGYDRLTSETCGSLWFHRFSVGCRKRMGQDWRPNRAISNPLMKELLTRVELRIRTADDLSERCRWVMSGAYFCFCYVVSLRSSEGLMVDVSGIRDFGEATQEHVVIPLLGQVKGEDHTRQHLIHCVNETDSGINVRRWISRLRAIHSILGKEKGPAFFNATSGAQSTTSEMNDMFIDLLTVIHDDHPELFSVDVKSAGDLPDKYHVYRSFRRGSESRAVSKEVSAGDRYQVNRWRKKESATSSKMSQPIDQLYVDVTLVKEAFLRYTKAM